MLILKLKLLALVFVFLTGGFDGVSQSDGPEAEQEAVQQDGKP